MEAFWQIVAATIGTIGFSLTFKIENRNLPAAAGNAVLSWSVYLLVFYFTQNIFTANLAAAICIELYGEVMARKLKAPVNVYLIPGIVPLLPGRGLYMAVHALITGEKAQSILFAKEVALTTLGVATGIVVMSTIVQYLLDRKGAVKK